MTDDRIMQQRKINNNLSQILNNLNTEYQVRDNIHKKQMNLLDKYRHYLTLNNKKLQRQTYLQDELNNFLNTRESLIRFNNLDYQRKQRNLRHIMLFSIGIGYMILVLVAYLSGNITLRSLLVNMVIVIVGYMAYLVFEYDIFGNRSLADITQSEVKNISQEFNEIENEISGYLRGNCRCPDSGSLNM